MNTFQLPNKTHAFESTKQSGAVLITSLMFLVVLTLVALVASQSTVLEARMSTNTIIKSRSFESSEALRMGSNDLLDGHMYNRGWPNNMSDGTNTGTLDPTLFSIPVGIEVSNVVDWGTDNAAGEDLFDPSTWTKDMTLRVDGNSDSDYNDDVDQKADMYVFKTVTVNSPGSATAMVAGYEGLGKSSAAGGALVFFDLRSVGASAGSSSTVTGSNYRYVVRN
jgi:hypothetical protein